KGRGYHGNHRPSEPSAPPPPPQMPPPPYSPEEGATNASNCSSRHLRGLVRAALEADEANGGVGGSEVVARYLDARRQLLAAHSDATEDSLKQLAASLLEKVNSRLLSLGVQLPDESNEADEPTVAATELFRLPDGVRLFFVASDGRIRHGGSNSSLSLFVFDDAATASEAEQSQSAQPPAFITVGSHWRCPLIPGVTPVLASASGALIFPDLEAQDEASSVGVMLPEGLDTESRFLLLDLLACLSRLGIERQPEAPEKPPPYAPTPTPTPAVAPADADADQKPARRHTSDHLVTGIGWTAARMCEGAVAGGRLAGDLLTRARLAAQKRMRPAAAGSSAGSAAGSAAGNSNESANLDHVTTGVRLLRQGSAVGVRVSRRLVSGLVSGAGFLASRVVYPHAVAPALNAVGVSTSGRGSRSRLAGAARVAGAALSGASDVWESLGVAGSQLATCAADNGQALATHRWGDRAGAVTGDALHAGGNVARIAWATNALGVRAALKVVAMETGKEAVGRMAESDGAKAASAASGSAPSTGAKR
ncbi:hypothetical protein BOX15_Mlig023119g3, partial [Macrostomum lignano]